MARTLRVENRLKSGEIQCFEVNVGQNKEDLVLPETIGFELEQFCFNSDRTPANVQPLLELPELHKMVSGELFQSMIEVVGGPWSFSDSKVGKTLYEIDRVLTAKGITPVCMSTPAIYAGEVFIEHPFIGNLIAERYGFGGVNQYKIGSTQIHVGIPNDFGFAVYLHNAYVMLAPLVAAFTANAPFLEGKFMGLPSVRHHLRRTVTNSGWPQLISTQPEHLILQVQGMINAGVISAFRGFANTSFPRPDLGTYEFADCDVLDKKGIVYMSKLFHIFTQRVLETYCSQAELPWFLQPTMDKQLYLQCLCLPVDHGSGAQFYYPSQGEVYSLQDMWTHLWDWMGVNKVPSQQAYETLIWENGTLGEQWMSKFIQVYPGDLPEFIPGTPYQYSGLCNLENPEAVQSAIQQVVFN